MTQNTEPYADRIDTLDLPTSVQRIWREETTGNLVVRELGGFGPRGYLPVGYLAADGTVIRETEQSLTNEELTGLHRLAGKTAEERITQAQHNARKMDQVRQVDGRLIGMGWSDSLARRVTRQRLVPLLRDLDEQDWAEISARFVAVCDLWARGTEGNLPQLLADSGLSEP